MELATAVKLFQPKSHVPFNRKVKFKNEYSRIKVEKLFQESVREEFQWPVAFLFRKLGEKLSAGKIGNEKMVDDQFGIKRNSRVEARNRLHSKRVQKV